jgi:hypothetical protein
LELDSVELWRLIQKSNIFGIVSSGDLSVEGDFTSSNNQAVYTEVKETTLEFVQQKEP